MSLIALATVSRSALAEPPLERVRLERGELLASIEPVEGSDTPFYVVRGVIDAAPERVWRVVEDCGRYRKTMVRVAASERLSPPSDVGDVVDCRLLMAMPFPLPNLTVLTRAQHRVQGGRFTRTWHLLEGDFAIHEGSWLLEPYLGNTARTLVTHRARVRPKLPVPEWVLAASKKETLEETLRNLRRQLAPAPETHPRGPLTMPTR